MTKDKQHKPMQAQEAIIRATVTITRAKTGKTETVQLIGKQKREAK